MNTSQQYEFLKTSSGLFDGTLEQSAAPVTQFVQALLDEPEAFLLYSEFAALDVDLQWFSGDRAELDFQALGLPTTLALGHVASSAQPQLAAPTTARPSSPAFIPKPSSFFSRPVLQYVALVALCLYGSFVLVAWNLRPDKMPNFTAGSPDSVAVVCDITDVQWSKNSLSKSTESSILSGELLKISSGTIELELKAGTKLVVEGPAEWSIENDNRALLHFGRLVARVPKRAIGFTLVTPTTTVVDLGTEFAVEVDQAKQTKVAVTKGAVELVSDAPLDNRSILHGQRERLVAGQAVTMTRDELGSVSSRRALFDTSWIPRAAELRPSFDPIASRPEGNHPFCQAVLQTPGLVAYWRLGENGRQGARDEIGSSKTSPLGRSRGIFHNFTAADFWQPGALQNDPNTAVRFNGTSSYIDCGNDAALNGRWEGVSIAAWINPASVATDRMELIAGNWGMDVAQGHFGLFKVGDKILIAVGDGVAAEGGLRGLGNSPLVPGRFQWVVGTWEAKSGKYQLYVNAQPDQASGLQAGNGINTHSGVPLVIGGWAFHEYHHGGRNFSGLIDEVCVFHRALSQAEIQSLFNANSEVANP